jgi:hypothetical protein
MVFTVTSTAMKRSIRRSSDQGASLIEARTATVGAPPVRAGTAGGNAQRRRCKTHRGGRRLSHPLHRGRFGRNRARGERKHNAQSVP